MGMLTEAGYAGYQSLFGLDSQIKCYNKHIGIGRPRYVVIAHGVHQLQSV